MTPAPVTPAPATPRRLAIVVTHPIQHFVHLYRALARTPDIEVKVFFCARIGLDPYFDREMRTDISWNMDLLSGYASEFLPGAQNIKVSSFRSINNPAVGARLDTFRPDAVLIYGYGTLTYLRALLHCRMHSIPILMMGDTDNVTQRGRTKTFLRRHLLKGLLSQVSAFLTVGDQNEDALRGVGVPNAKMFRSPFTIDEQAYRHALTKRSELRAQVRHRFGISDDAFVALFVGKLSPRKRPGDLLDALALTAAQQSGRAVYGLMCGNGELHDLLVARVASEALPVSMAGFVNVDQLPAFFVAADVLVHPAAHDPHPLICSEAAICGLPMILSDRVGAVGRSDVARGGLNAIVYRCGDIEQLTGAIAALASDPARCASMSERSTEFYEACDLRASTSGVLNAVASCAMMRPPRKGQ